MAIGSDSNNLERKDFSSCVVSEELSPNWLEERIGQLKLWRWECGKAILSGQPRSIAQGEPKPCPSELHGTSKPNLLKIL